jgi:rod shape-determining protein MreD
MLPLKRRTPFTPPPTALEAQLVPVISTMVGSLAVIAPNIATEPLLPPFGLMVFLGWRLLRGDIWPLWMGLPLGLWDDLFSGQPIGTAMCGWTVIMLLLDYVDRRAQFRDHRQDWMLAGMMIASYLLFALAIAWITGGATSPVALVPQILLSALLFPLITRVCAALDRWRSPR